MISIVAFPVQIPLGFEPWDIYSRNKKLCPGQDKRDGYRPRFGGGFNALRGPKRVLHRAIDIMCAVGAEIRAVDGGRVQRIWRYKGKERPGAGESTKGGYYVRIVHGWGITYYAHLVQFPLVSPGQDIVANDLLGYAGRSGNAALGCPHLHLSMTRGKTLIDPVPWLRPLYLKGAWKQ